MLKKNWTFDARTNTYVFGVPNNGGGVFQELDYKWYGNSVIEHGDIVCFGPYNSMIETQEVIEKDYDERNAS